MVAAVAVAAALAACGRAEEPKRIRLESPAASPGTGAVGTAAPANGAARLRVAIAAMISPKETFASYRDLLRHIGKRMGMEVELVQRRSYEEINELLKKNLLDVAFVCTGAYVEGHDDFGMEILVAPVTQGRTAYYSYIIVSADSQVRSLEELEGKTFAFTDPLSNTGKLAPTYALARKNRSPDRFFSQVVYTYSHDRSIESVAKKLVDGAAVDSLVWDYMSRKNPALTAGTKVVLKSDPFGIPPVVVSRALSPEMKGRLRDVFLRIHEDREGREILSAIMIDRFVAVNDDLYDSVRAMRRWVERNAGK